VLVTARYFLDRALIMHPTRSICCVRLDRPQRFRVFLSTSALRYVVFLSSVMHRREPMIRQQQLPTQCDVHVSIMLQVSGKRTNALAVNRSVLQSIIHCFFLIRHSSAIISLHLFLSPSISLFLN